jgi:hypothetical protein
LQLQDGRDHPVVMKEQPTGIFRYGVVAAAFLILMCSGAARAAPSCHTALAPPVPGKTVRPYLPIGKGGHWGVDLAAARFEVVRSPVSGSVTFAGRVAGRKSMTLAPQAGIRVSISHLSELWVTVGQRVTVGQPVGRSGEDRGISAVHVSLRVDGRYTDPQPALDCHSGWRRMQGELRLLPFERIMRLPSGARIITP